MMKLTEAERKAVLDIASKVWRGLTPEERGKIGKALTEAASDFIKAVNPPKEEVLGLMHSAFSSGYHSEGGRLAQIDAGEHKLAFEIPPEADRELIKVDRVMTEPEVTEFLYKLDWSRRWSEEIIKMAAPDVWARATPAERERMQKDLIRRKLIPILRR